ncbi:vWA domain-containing protein [Tsukamurella soli]|uniref:VWA domain-containing protein n=1 Tax=Tsukamurella soli TaxID=644556 RepID=A0ABP8K6R8_9ACTN
MTDPTSSLIAVLLDRSGSMESIRTDMIGGFAAFMDTQRTVPGDVRVTLAQFDTEYEVVYADRPLADVGPLVLQPRGMTALLDGIGQLTAEIGVGLARLPEDRRPGSVVVVVITDGLENSSVEYTRDAVAELIRRQESEYSWTYVFLGANMDAVAVGASLGFQPTRSLTYAPAAEGVAATYRAAARFVADVRSAPAGAPPPAGFTEEERSAARGD